MSSLIFPGLTGRRNGLRIWRTWILVQIFGRRIRHREFLMWYCCAHPHEAMDRSCPSGRKATNRNNCIIPGLGLNSTILLEICWCKRENNSEAHSIGDDGKDLEADCVDGSTEVWIELMPLNCVLKNCQKGVLYVIYLLPQFKIFQWKKTKTNQSCTYS